MTDKLYMVYLIKGHQPLFYLFTFNGVSPFFTFLPFYFFTFLGVSPFFYLFTFLPFKKAIGFLPFRFSLFL